MIEGRPAIHEGKVIAAAKTAKLPDGYTRLDWALLGDFEYMEGMTFPKRIRDLNGKKVGVAGYMMSLDKEGGAQEILLVESQWSCCFGSLPELNQILVVRIPKATQEVFYTAEPVVILGTFDAGEELEDGWVVSVYHIEATELQEPE